MTTLGLPGTQGNSSKSLNRVKSAVDANAILLRLAGKPVGKKAEQEDGKKSKGKSKNKDQKGGGKNGPLKCDSRKNSLKCESRKNSVLSPVKDSVKGTSVGEHEENVAVPDMDWYGEEMDEATIATFRDLFNMLDQSNTGIITADNLYAELSRVDSEITYSEVEDVLRKVDKDGDGTIDFDEFLYHMTNTGGDLFGDGDDTGDEAQKKKFSRRQKFFTAITQFSIRQTLADIEKTFRNQAPHVISHYTAGVRLIGLTTRQLERQMKEIKKAAEKNDSPYAKPLQFVHLGRKKIVHKKKAPTASERVASEVDQHVAEEEHDPEVADLSKEIKDTMKMFAEQKPNMLPRIHDANIIMQLRQKLGSVTAKMRESQAIADDKIVTEKRSSTLAVTSTKSKSAAHLRSTGSSLRSRRKKPKPQSAGSIRNVSKRKQKKMIMGLGWTTPRIQYIDVPLPSLKMTLTSEKPTFNDLHRIRAKAREAIDAYYHHLRQAEIKNAWDHWDRLYADVITPKKLLENFRVVYGAYSPHREEEAFVVCPWQPGPFRYICHMAKPAARTFPKVPDVSIINPSAASKMSRKSTRAGVVRTTGMNHQPKFSHSAQMASRDTPSPLQGQRPLSSMAEQ